MLDALGKVLVAFSAGITTVPPRVGIRVPDLGLMGSMPGYVPGVALEVKLVSVFPGNHHLGVPSHQGLIALFDEGNGAPLAIMDATYITAIRTGGAAAVPRGRPLCEAAQGAGGVPPAPTAAPPPPPPPPAPAPRLR